MREKMEDIDETSGLLYIVATSCNAAVRANMNKDDFPATAHQYSRLVHLLGPNTHLADWSNLAPTSRLTGFICTNTHGLRVWLIQSGALDKNINLFNIFKFSFLRGGKPRS